MEILRMHPHLRLVIALVVTIVLGACGEEQLPPGPGATKFQISGQIIAQDDINVSGIVIKIGASVAVSDSAGHYRFTNLPNGTYTLTPQGQGLIFTPDSLTVNVNGQNVNSQNFLAQRSLPDGSLEISGQIIAQGNINVEGIVIKAGALTAVSDNTGRYVFANLTNGTYLLKPQGQGLVFIPDSLVVNVNGQNVSAQNFLVYNPQPADTLITLPGGSFIMGSDNDNIEERPTHAVTVRMIAMGKYEVTQKQWREVMGNNPSEFIGDDLPVEKVSWPDAIAYCNARSLSEGLQPAYVINGNSTTCNFNANGYRLPTEAEWEYACRAGTTTDYYSGNRSNNSGCYSEPVLDAIGWYCNNSGGRTHPVGQKQPNAFGFFDMTGNVFEWCWDWNGDYPAGPQNNPTGPTSGSLRICRGGSWFFVPQQSRSTFRLAYLPSSKFSGVGFRVVRSIP